VASASIRRDLDTGAIERILRGPTGAVARDQYRRALKVQAAARGFVGTDTGYLASRIEVRPYVGRDGAHAFKIGVWTVRYARVHHDGNWHRQGAYIRPVRARALRFVIGGRVIFAAKVRSYRGSKYLTKALRFAR
jgi:hypothetical protein